MFRILLGFILAAVSAVAAFAEKRVALVIGNSAYQNAAPLANPANDAQAMANKFAALGFEVIEGYDLDKLGMDVKLREFSLASRDSDMNVFFYAGHGMAVNGQNYLVPIDAMFADEVALDFEAVPVDFITRQMSFSDAVNLVFLDACRDNPLSTQLSRSLGGGTRSGAISQGLSEMKITNPGKGLAIAFATSPGEVAYDGEGANSPFTTALLKHIDAPNTDIAEVFSRVTGEVYQTTAQQQRPWLNMSLTGSVVLNATPAALETTDDSIAAANSGSSATAGDQTANLDMQKMLFDIARDSDNVEDYRAYLDTFPNGLFANNARRRIRTLEGGAVVASTDPKVVQGAVGDNSRARSINENGALSLTATPAVQAAPANQATEAALGLDKQKRGEIQSRLTATGNDTRGIDGSWGRNTRTALANWQAQNGLAPTGFMNSLQLDLLVSQTEGRFVPYVPRAATASRPATTGTTQRTTQRTQQRTQPRGATPGEVGQILQGVGSILQGINR